MGTFSIWHWLIVLAVVLILFGGGGKIPRLMGDLARGVKSFKTGLKDEDKVEEAEVEEPVKRVSETAEKPAAEAKPKAKKAKASKSRKTVSS